MKFGDCESITLPLRVENASAENGKSGAEPVAHGSGQPPIPQVTARTLLGTTCIVG